MAVWSVVHYCELSDDLRIDSEHYRPEVLQLRAAIRESAYPVHRLEDLSRSVINFGAYSLCNDIVFQETGVPFITAQDIQEGFIDFTCPRFISKEQHRTLLWKSAVKQGQVLVAMAARLGVAAVYNGSAPLNSSQDVAKVALTNADETNPYYVAAFINAKVGRDQLLASQTGSVQQHTNLGQIKNLKIVVLPSRLQKGVAALFEAALQERDRAESCYDEGEALLLSSLGLNKLDLSPSLFYVRHYSDTTTAGRVDAEYFSPRYQRVLNHLRQGGQTIGDVAPLAERKFQAEAGATFSYIEIGNLAGNGEARAEVMDGGDAPSRAQWIVQPGDVISSTVRPIRRLSALISKEQAGHVCSSGFAVLHPTGIEPEVLLVYLRLPIVCEILNLHTTASMYPTIPVEQLLRIPIALPAMSVRDRIVDKVQAAFAARREAARLLDEAKSAVERLILKN